MELVTPFGHLVRMELFLSDLISYLVSIVSVVGAVLAGAILLAVGVFSIVSLLWEDLLENTTPEGTASPELSRAA